MKRLILVTATVFALAMGLCTLSKVSVTQVSDHDGTLMKFRAVTR